MLTNIVWVNACVSTVGNVPASKYYQTLYQSIIVVYEIWAFNCI